MPLARYIMIGGFLGAGKTTAMVKLAEHLAAKGLRAGLITNDQSVGLVDTQRVLSAGFAVREITGGCFCCKFNSLVQAAQQLTKESAPDVLIAEPVGSCTDIKATVCYPLRHLYAQDYHVAPLSVLVDPIRCARVLGLSSGNRFSEKVLYVYRKQLEEAELLVINKVDLLDPAQRAPLASALRQEFPQAQVLEVSCNTGEGLATWFDLLCTGTLGQGAAMEVDYDLYAQGEALLGWLNAAGSVSLDEPFDGNLFLKRLANQLHHEMTSREIEIAHLKMTLLPDEGPDLGAISLTRTDADPQPTHSLKSPLQRGELTINLRAQADPADLREVLARSLSSVYPVEVRLAEVNAFRPGRPNPTHRIAGA